LTYSNEPLERPVLSQFLERTVFLRLLSEKHLLYLFSAGLSLPAYGVLLQYLFEKNKLSFVDFCQTTAVKGKRKICQRMSVWENKIISMNGEKLMKYKFELVKCYSFKFCFFRF